MNNYKLAVSKNGKKYTIIFKAENEILARERVHNEGYSILSIEVITEKDELGNTFLFTAYTKEGELKHGRIVGDDILKSYIKLRKNLEYDVKKIFSEKDKDLDENAKNSIVKDLNEEYNLLFKGQKKERIDILRDQIQKDKDKNNSNNVDNFYLKKELDETYKLIDFVLIKLDNLLSGTSIIKLNSDDKEKLKIVYNSIIKLKKTTNISKLKEIGELALIKIGRLELKEVENKHEEEASKLLKQTNVLLKKIGSKESFIEKNKDVLYIINNLFKNINNYFLSFKEDKEEKKIIDKDSHSYAKNKLFLKRYKEKLKENNIFILTNLISFLFNKEIRIETLIRRKVIKQNITLFLAKESGVGYSYTSVKKGLAKLIDYILFLIKNVNEYLFIVILLYTFLYIAFLNINYYYKFTESNYEGLFYFIVLFFIYLILYFTKNLLLIILNFVILFFIVIFGVVNF